MTTERAKEFQVRITKEALALMVIHNESASSRPSARCRSTSNSSQTCLRQL